MSSLVISAEGLSKRYHVGTRSASYGTLRDSMVGTFGALRGLARSNAGKTPASGEFWALQDVSFDVTRGDVLGIIGRNGAGKSTLLKILSRITEPTWGTVRVGGRVGSLLEVCTGFHPELTGRENTYLNGAILGMSRSDIKRRFDEIVDFSGVEQFLDTPVKYYSSGMYMRLAFSVAAHLEPDILIIDEVLAVGDADFQRKCLGKMGQVAREGRTVIFVSHNLGAVGELCSRGILLEQGKLRFDGTARDAIHQYVAATGRPGNSGTITSDMHVHDPLELAFRHAILLDRAGNPTTQIVSDAPLLIRLGLEVRSPVEDVRLAVAIAAADMSIVAITHNTDRGGQSFSGQPGHYTADLRVDCPLSPGTYFAGLAAKPMPGHWGSGRTMDWVEGAVVFEVGEVTDEGWAAPRVPAPLWPGASWQVRKANDSVPRDASPVVLSSRAARDNS
jgi:lipopolysaccharide transport system ATP-binding protein